MLGFHSRNDRNGREHIKVAALADVKGCESFNAQKTR
jgi:hypothetical protein